jgi:NAD-dependent deacetylase
MKISLVVLTGAGVSADSGIDTFRGAGGLWEGHRAEEVATPEAWAHSPEMVWRFYQMRRAKVAAAVPNAAHHALARLEAGMEAAVHSFTLISQNVDDLHQRSGSSVISMHGSLAVLRCERCGEHLADLEYFDSDAFLACPSCDHDRLRPDVVWFGEMPYALEEIDRVVRGATHFLSCGTSGFVYPAAGLLAVARESGAETFVNSLDEPGNLDPRDRFLPGRAAEVIPELVEEWLGRWGRE